MLGAMLFAGATAPQIGDIKTFNDWIVGCDNGRLCQADGVLPEGDYKNATIAVRRGAEGDAVPQIWIRVPDGTPADILVDGRPLHLRFMADEDVFGVAVEDSPRLAEAVVNARALVIIDSTTKPLANISPDGAAAALLYMDEQQHRVGSVTALVRKGPAPASSIPPPPPLPEIVSAAPSKAPPVRLKAPEVRKIRGEDACNDPKEEAAVEYARLDASSTLALIENICVSGAYNFDYTPLIIGNDGKYRDADFDDSKVNDFGTYNAGWDAGTHRLQTGFKGRGIGDCGSWSTYAWDGKRFRLVGLELMSDCRGSTDFISLWRAKVVEKH
jgi:hypothetical protein